MANTSMIADLLKTPSQVRAEEQEKLRNRALQRQNSILAQGTSDRSLFGGGFQGFAGQVAGQIDPAMDTVKRNLLQLAGGDPRSTAERTAAANQDVMRVAMSGNLTKMKELQKQLASNPNADPRLVAAVTSRINAEEKRLSDLENAGKGSYTEKLTGPDKQAIREATEAAQSARVSSEDALNLAIRYGEELPTGGILGSAFSKFRKFMGGTNEIDLLKANFNKIRMSGVLSALPPGPASDKDIANAEKGFPDESFNAQQIASWLRGYAKAKRIEAGYRNFYAKYLSDNFGNSAGVNEAWAKHFEDNLELYWSDTGNQDDMPEGMSTQQEKGVSKGTATVPQVIDFNDLVETRPITPNEQIIEESTTEESIGGA